MTSAQRKQPVTETPLPPAGDLFGPKIVDTTNPCGSWLASEGAAQSTLMLTDPPPSLASQRPQVVFAVRGAHRSYRVLWCFS